MQSTIQKTNSTDCIVICGIICVLEQKRESPCVGDLGDTQEIGEQKKIDCGAWFRLLGTPINYNWAGF